MALVWQAYGRAAIRGVPQRGERLPEDSGRTGCVARNPPRARAAGYADMGAREAGARNAIAVPLRMASPMGALSFLSTTTVFGPAVDVTLSEVTIESFFPADQETARIMAGLAAGG